MLQSTSSFKTQATENTRLIQPIDLLQRLVQIPSHESVEKCQSLVESLMRKSGLEVRTFNSSSNPCADSTTVIGILRGKAPEKARSLMLVTHADTVPAEPLDRWKYQAFEGSIHEGKMYGRGVYDDKAGIVLMLQVAEQLAHDKQLDGDLILCAVSDDESSGESFKILAQNEHADACLILDGAKVHQICYGHLGCIWYRLEVQGTTTSCNNRATNAIEKTTIILDALFRLADQLNATIEGPYKVYGRPVRLNISSMHGGEWLGNNAAHCVTEFSLNFLSPETVATVNASISRIVDKVVSEDEWLCEHKPLLKQVHMAFDPYQSSLDSNFYRVVSTAHKDVTGVDLEPRVITGWFHGSSFSCPCFLYGPGNGGSSHGADEFFEIDSFDQLLPPLLEIARRWCSA